MNGLEIAGILKGGEKMKVTAKEWRVMSDHNKQLLLNAVATK
ncbi:hypothetical protein ACIQZG_11875 [Lysinibacillus sp. NPDC096418]